jgi:pimeloyl-ACP methyl ester carboxylesterase
MSEVRVHISVSADGYAGGPDQSLENPLGEGGEDLHDWVVALKAWREPHGLAVVVVGHSLGGFTAPLVSTHVPVDLLVLVAAMIPSPGELFDDWWATTSRTE